MFVNRTAKLARLKTRWRVRKAQLLIVYGKRRVIGGKTGRREVFALLKAVFDKPEAMPCEVSPGT